MIISERHLSAINTFVWGKMITFQQLYTVSTHITVQLSSNNNNLTIKLAGRSINNLSVNCRDLAHRAIITLTVNITLTLN